MLFSIRRQTQSNNECGKSCFFGKNWFDAAVMDCTDMRSVLGCIEQSGICFLVKEAICQILGHSDSCKVQPKHPQSFSIPQTEPSYYVCLVSCLFRKRVELSSPVPSGSNAMKNLTGFIAWQYYHI